MVDALVRGLTKYGGRLELNVSLPRSFDTFRGFGFRLSFVVSRGFACSEALP